MILKIKLSYLIVFFFLKYYSFSFPFNPIQTSCDTGLYWSVLTIGCDSCQFFTIDFINDSTGYVGGINYDNGFGVIYKTDDGGCNWYKLPIPLTYAIINIFVLNDLTCYALDESYYFLRTFDGGQTWTTHLPGLTPYTPRSLVFIDKYTGYISIAGNDSAIYKTSNSGDTWLKVGPVGASLSFPSLFTGYSISGKNLFKTIDEGDSWNIFPIITDSINADTFSKILFINDTIGFIIGTNIPTQKGYVAKTFNGGNSWSISYYGNNAFDFFAVNMDTLYLNIGSGIIKSIDGGNQWETVYLPDTGYPFTNLFLPQKGIDCPSSNICYCIANTMPSGNNFGYDRILKTTTGGAPLSIPEQIENRIISISPNPFSSHLTIQFEPTATATATATFSLYSSTGKLVYQNIDKNLPPGKHQKQMDTRNLLPGLYFLIANINNQIQTFKTLKINFNF
ncbi:MAG: T9SS type A sorting domain-containing protein [Bacteroidetes bacterium]|nr:T9SS type A sorting domain-containing protein [Bacteroidota bacterium]